MDISTTKTCAVVAKYFDKYKGYMETKICGATEYL